MNAKGQKAPAHAAKMKRYHAKRRKIALQVQRSRKAWLRRKAA